MNSDKTKKRQSLKIIISEAIMVLAVIITVAILALLVSGYWINSDFEVERQGMLQIYSSPTGANVNIDGEASSWLQRTNTSKVLSSGEHTVTLSKDGYDSWSKTINVKEGLLYRLHYPRLFLTERTPEKTLSTAGTTHAILASDHDSLVLTNNTTNWSYLKLNADKLEPKSLDISKYFSGVSLAEGTKTGLFTGEILDANWDYNTEHILFQVKNNDAIEWVLIDVKNPDNSINLTKEFGGNFSTIKILDNSSNNLLAIQHGNLHKIDVPGRSVSAVLVDNILNFDHFRNEIIFTAKTHNDSSEQISDYYIGYFKIGDDEITKIMDIDSPSKVAISKFYDDKYITILSNTSVTIYKKDNLEHFANYDLSFTPEHLKVGRDGEFITMYTGNTIATVDMEANTLREWTADGNSFGWLDNDMIYSVADGELYAYDFDGLNRRHLAKNVSSHFPSGITDNKWLYYFSDDNLIREIIAE